MNLSNSTTQRTIQCMCRTAHCEKKGLFRAPKSPDEPHLFIWLCLEHVREHNAQWNYLEGSSQEEIEKRIRNATVWERPTWPFGKGPLSTKSGHTTSASTKPTAPPASILLCLSVFNLKHPVTMVEIKGRYRQMVKQFHPDTSSKGKTEIEKFYSIQQAFGTLQKYYATKRNSKNKPSEW